MCIPERPRKTLKVTDLWEKEAILCTTEKECNKILDLMHEAWLKWWDWESYKEKRYMDYICEWQVYNPYRWTNWKVLYYSDFKLYDASDFIDGEYKMWHNVIDTQPEAEEEWVYYSKATISPSWTRELEVRIPKRFRI